MALSSQVGQLDWEVVHRWLGAGERPLDSTELDMFQHRRLATRIAKAVGRDGRSVALLGQFGAGKTSILNTVRSELSTFKQTIAVTSLDVWAVPNPEDVPRLALNQILAALDDYVDTIEFRSLPISYQRLAAAEPTGRLSSAIGGGSASDSVAELERLNPVLEGLDARVVLIVEDIERAGDDFDTRHLARFLWALRRVTRSSLVLAVDPAHAKVDFPKLCDSIELVPALDVKKVADILTVAYAHWSGQYSDIDPHPMRDRSDKLKLEYARQGGMLDFLRRTGRDTPLDALVSLLQTPRSLKHVLRRIDDSWQALHGESEIDDIVTVSALRHGAQPVYEFLVADIDAARNKPNDVLPRTMTVKGDWEALLATIPSRAAVQKLINVMGITQLSTKDWTSDEKSPQGVHITEPVDYFRRIVAGELSPGEIADQAVLGDIDRWNAGADTALLAGLVASTDEEDQYVLVWEHFAFRHSDDQLAALINEVIDFLLARDGASADAKHTAAIALWRQGHRRFPQDSKSAWLGDLILRAVPVSARMVNGLYHFWTGDQGIVGEEAQDQIREAVAKSIRLSIQTYDDLARVLPQDRSPYELGRLISQTGRNSTAAAFAEWREHISPLLLEGSRQRPEVFLPELANMAGDRESSLVAAANDYPPIFAGRYRIDRERFEALFGNHSEEALRLLAEYDGQNPYALRAIADARAWLAERELDDTRE